MLRTGRMLTVAALLTLLASQAQAQKPGKDAALSTDNVPAAWEGQSTADWGPIGPGVSPPPWAVPPPGPLPYEDKNGPLLKGDPLLDSPPYAPPGWFAGLEVDPVWTHVKNRLGSPVSVGSITDQVQLPSAQLGVTVSPHVEVGYRLPEGAGELLVGYRFVETAGSGSVTSLGPAGDSGALRSRLDLNVFDLDYGSREFSLGPKWDMKWLVGVRITSLYLDSQAADAVLSQRETDHFAGAGPQGALELWRCLGDSGLALYGRLDCAFLVGRIRQSFTDTFAPGGPGNGETDNSQIQGVPMVAAQAGLGWRPAGCPQLRFAAGYTWERWWDVGAVPGSHAEVTVQGLFLRGEWRY